MDKKFKKASKKTRKSRISSKVSKKVSRILKISLKILTTTSVIILLLLAIGFIQEAERKNREIETSLPANIIIEGRIIEGHSWIVSQGNGIRESFVKFNFQNQTYRLSVPTDGVVEHLEILNISNLEKKRVLVNYKIREFLPRFIKEIPDSIYQNPIREISSSEKNYNFKGLYDQKIVTIEKKNK